MNIGDKIQNPVDLRDAGYYKVIELKELHHQWFFKAQAINDFCRFQTISGAVPEGAAL